MLSAVKIFGDFPDASTLLASVLTKLLRAQAAIWTTLTPLSAGTSKNLSENLKFISSTSTRFSDTGSKPAAADTDDSRAYRELLA